MSSVTPTTLPIEPTTSSLSTPDGLTDILSQAQQKLQQAAASSDLFVQVFGEKANSQELMAVQTAWASGDFSLFPQVQILTDANLNGAHGAYAAATQSIYLSESMLQGSTADALIGGAVGVLVEEAFHFADSLVGPDTLGDEGELARRLIYQDHLSTKDITQIRQDNDAGFIAINNQVLSVEFSTRRQITLGNFVDFNGDGRSDFLRQERGGFANDQWRMLETNLSNGNGTFTRVIANQEANRKMHGDLTNLFMGDFNGDGRTDFIRQEKGGFASDPWMMMETYLSNGNGTFRLAGVMNDTAMHGDQTKLFIGDFNGDGRSDFLRQERGGFANDQWRMLETYLSNGNGTFTRVTANQEANRKMHGDLTNLFTGDFNGDGRTDFIRQEKGGFASDQWIMLETYLSNGNGTFRVANVMNDTAMHGDQTKLFIGDFNGDGRSDFLRQERGGFANDQWRMLETYLSNGNGTFTRVTANEESNRKMHGDLTNLFMGDFNGDGRTDFIRQEKGGFASDQWIMLETYLSNGNGTFRVASVMNDAAMHGDLTNLFVGDFNGDRRADFLRQERGGFASDTFRMLETYTSLGGSFTKSAQFNDHAMHGDLTNLFTSNTGISRQAAIQPQPTGYYRDLASLTDDQWDQQSGDNTQFEQNPYGGGGDQRWKTDDRIEQIYTDLSSKIFGTRKAMNAGYVFDASYRPGGVKKYHSGIDIAALTGTDSVRTAVRGRIVRSYYQPGNGHWMAIDELDSAGNKTGRQWWYGHMQAPVGGPASWVGKTLEAGTILAKAGMGHLHLAVKNAPGSIASSTKSAQDMQSSSMSPLHAYWKAKNGIKEAVIWN